jgi:hypothetical protein
LSLLWKIAINSSGIERSVDKSMHHEIPIINCNDPRIQCVSATASQSANVKDFRAVSIPDFSRDSFQYFLVRPIQF